MNKSDKKLLDIIQRDFPVNLRPYLSIAKKLKMSEKEVINKLKYFKDNKIIRSFAPSFDSKKIGFASTLVASKVPEHKIKKVVEIINKYPEITHNYKRDASYNVWFAIVAKNGERIKTIIMEIKIKTGIDDFFSLPALKLFKISAVFKL